MSTGCTGEEALTEGRKIRAERNRAIHERREQGATQQQIADEFGLSHQHVSRVLHINPAIAEKRSKPKKRVEIKVSISKGTNPAVAARRKVRAARNSRLPMSSG